MSLTNKESINKTSIAIVGGGISGILLALKLSRDAQMVKNGIVLIEKQPQIGGRLFFSSPLKFSGKNHQEIHEEIFSQSSQGQNLSGFGFEIMAPQASNALLRHIQSYLNENELSLLEDILQKIEYIKDSTSTSKIFFIKKEFTNLTEITQGSSEIMTKKESEAFHHLLSFYQEYNEAEHKKDWDIFFEKSLFWNELSKNAKETLSPIVQTVVGPNFGKTTFLSVCKKMHEFFALSKEIRHEVFSRKHCIELFLEHLLRNRGVKIRTFCEVIQVNSQSKNKETTFELTLADTLFPNQNHLECNKLIFAIPLVQCLGVIPKENFSPEQARFVSKVRPISLVISEINDFMSLKNEHCPNTLTPSDKLVFPVERVYAYLTDDGRMLFTTQLDYEDSLQAPSVREAIGRLRRAAQRVLNNETAKEIKKGARIPQNKVTERIVLLPVSITVPPDTLQTIEVKNTKMAIQGLFCCGDNFPQLASEPWMRVVNSVQSVFESLKN